MEKSRNVFDSARLLSGDEHLISLVRKSLNMVDYSAHNNQLPKLAVQSLIESIQDSQKALKPFTQKLGKTDISLSLILSFLTGLLLSVKLRLLG